MAKINTIEYIRFGNENFLQFCREFCAIIARNPIIAERFGYLTVPYAAAVEELDEAMKKPTWSDLTEPIAKKDEARDKVLISFKAWVESQRHYSPTEGVTLAAEKVYRFIKLNHSNPAAQYDKETAQISNLLQDLAQYCEEEVELMGVQPMLTELKKLNDEMAALLTERDIQDSLKRNEAVKNARRNCDRLYVALKDTVNAAALVDAEGALTAFINAINQMLKRQEVQVLKQPVSGGEETLPPTDGETDGEQTDGEQTDGEQGSEETGGEGTGSETTEPTFTVTYIKGQYTWMTQQYAPGDRIVPPAEPEAYRWVDVPEFMPDHDITIYAQYVG